MTRARKWTCPSYLFLFGLLTQALPFAASANLAIPAKGQTALRIEGSNSIGIQLAPALVRGLLEQEGLQSIQVEPQKNGNIQRVSAKSANGQEVLIDVVAQGSSSGFVALQNGSAELAASSRPIKDSEASGLSNFGNMQNPDAEHVIGIDGIALITHPSNPVASLSMKQLAQVFSGEITDWKALGGREGAIRLNALDDNSGTFETFNSVVLSRYGKKLAANTSRFESNTDLSVAVSEDPQALGFVALAAVGRAKTLPIADGSSAPMAPAINLIASEDYPLSRRLYFYIKPGEKNPWAKALVNFSQTAKGQSIVANSGFVAQTVEVLKVESNEQMPKTYQQLAQNAQRLSVSFRFMEGSASLDSKSRQDLARVLNYLKSTDKLQQHVSLVGFGDATDDPERAALLSKLRAMAVRRELAKGGVTFREITGLGDELPLSANNDDAGRAKNRRVEVWVY